MAQHSTVWRLAKLLAVTAATIAAFCAPARSATQGMSSGVFAHAFSVSVSHVLGWTPMYERHLRTAETNPTWQELIVEGRKVFSDARLEHVNGFFNRVVYRSDAAVWGKADYWATPAELLARGGDCEDFAIAKFLALRELGMPSSDMRIIVLRGETEGSDHAILMVETVSGPMILDNLRSDIYRLSSRMALRVAFAFNDTHMWIPGETFLAALQH